MYLNKTNLIGNLTKKPELKTLPSGGSVSSFSLATNRTWKDKNSGEKKSEVEFHNCVAFGKTAELIAQYCDKGSQLYLEGRLRTRSWEKDGIKKYTTEIIIETMQFGNKPKQEAPAKQESESNFEPPLEYPEDNGGDIPF